MKQEEKKLIVVKEERVRKHSLDKTREGHLVEIGMQENETQTANLICMVV